MNLQTKDHLREMQLALIGKLMAGLSHEFKNHLAIIKELNGLIEDLLLLEKSGQTDNSERYQKAITGINERIVQAAEMCRFLSSFSHRMDQPLSSFSVADAIDEEIYLMHRFAKQKQVNLTFAPDADLPPVYNDPSLLQFALFCNIWPALESLEPGGNISIMAGCRKDAVEITVAFQGAMGKSEEMSAWEVVLPEALQMLGAEQFRRISQNGNEEIVLTVSSTDTSGIEEI